MLQSLANNKSALKLLKKVRNMSPPRQPQPPAEQEQASAEISEWDDILLETEETCPGLVGTVDVHERDLAHLNMDTCRVSFCALLSNLAYKVRTKNGLKQALLHHMSLAGEGEDFQNVRHCHVRADKSWDHRMLTVIKGKTLYVAWKGTDNLRDLVRDLSCLPKNCFLWSYLFPNILAHAGIVDVIEHQFHYMPDLVQLLEKYPGVEKIVFTGHSLGAGLAQVALMATYGQQALEYYHWPDQKVRDKARRLLKDVTFSCQAFASPMIFSIESDAKLNEKEHAVLEKFHSNCNMLFYEGDLIPRVPAHKDYFMPAMRSIIKAMGTERGKQRAVGPTTELLFGKMARAGAKKVVWPMMQGAWDPETLAAFETYKHISTLVHVTGTAESAIVAQRTTHEELLQQDYDSSIQGLQLLQMHRVLPKCFGRYMAARRKALLVPSNPQAPASSGRIGAAAIMTNNSDHSNETATTITMRKTYASGSSYVGEYEQQQIQRTSSSNTVSTSSSGISGQATSTTSSNTATKLQRSGRGTCTLANGDWYVGGWKEDQINGYGTYYWAETGEWYVGGWKMGAPHGQGHHSNLGRATWANGMILEESSIAKHSQHLGLLAGQDMSLRDWQQKFSQPHLLH